MLVFYLGGQGCLDKGDYLPGDIVGNNALALRASLSRSDSKGTESHYRLSLGLMGYLGECDRCLSLQNVSQGNRPKKKN